MRHKSVAEELITLGKIAQAFPDTPLPGLEPNPIPGYPYIVPDVIGILARAFWAGEFEESEIGKKFQDLTSRNAFLLQMRKERPDIIESYIEGFPEINLLKANNETWFTFLEVVKYRDFREIELIEQIEFRRLVFWRWCESKKQSNPGAIDPRWQAAILRSEDAYPLLAGTSFRGRGRPKKHDYSQIDAELEDLHKIHGTEHLKKSGEVAKHLVSKFGEANVPNNSTLRSHIQAWLSPRIHPQR